MKYLLLLLMFFCSVSAAFAQTQAVADERIMVIVPPEEENVESNANMPTCDNQRVIADVKEAITAYLQQHNSGSIIEKRKRNLVVKNIDKYTEIPVAEFDNSQNYLVANELVMTKINRKVKEQNLRLCVGEGKIPVYLLIYPEDFGYRVQIINFISPGKNGNEFSVFYAPEVRQYDNFEN